MKKIFFLLAFAFIGQQAFSQMYIVTLTDVDDGHPEYSFDCGGQTYDRIMAIIDPQGNITYKCIPYETTDDVESGGNNLALINQEFNSILNQGYKLIYVDPDNSLLGDNIQGIWYFAIP